MQISPTVPAPLLVAAQGSPLEFAMALAIASVPAGIEIRQPDDVLPANLPIPDELRPPGQGAASAHRVPLTEVVRTFNRRSDYRAVETGGVLVIRPVREMTPILDEASAITAPTKITGVMAAARRVFSQVNPAFAGPALGSMYGHMHGEDLTVVLDGSGRTVIETLNQIVRQAPPRIWVVTTQKQGDAVRIVQFGFIAADGSRRRMGMGVRRTNGDRVPLLLFNPLSPAT
jgi:hypothetical protein